jgi:excisionase family DNA binding protein
MQKAIPKRTLLGSINHAPELASGTDPTAEVNQGPQSSGTIRPRMVTITEVGVITRMSSSKLNREIRDGKIQAVKCRSRTLIPIEAVKAYLNALQPAPKRAASTVDKSNPAAIGSRAAIGGATGTLRFDHSPGSVAQGVLERNQSDD